MAAAARAHLQREAEAIEARMNAGREEEDVDEDPEEEEDEEWELERAALAEMEAERSGARRETTNDTRGLARSLNQFAWEKEDLEWEDTMAISLGEDVEQVENVDDDLQRELAFYKQALVAAQTAAKNFEEQGVQWKRPEDYFAEMVKSDAHMDRVRKKLIEERTQMEAVDQAKKARENRRYAKQVEAERRKEKAQTKKKEVEKVTKWRQQRKRNGYAGDADLPEAAGLGNKRSKTPMGAVRGTPKGAGNKSKKRQYKDAKFGFGGPKRRLKQNDANSAADVSGYKSSGFDKKGLKTRNGGVQKKQSSRPGKAKRQQNRNRRT